LGALFAPPEEQEEREPWRPFGRPWWTELNEGDWRAELPAWLQGVGDWAYLTTQDIGEQVGRWWEKPVEREARPAIEKAEAVQGAGDLLSGLEQGYQSWVESWYPEWLSQLVTRQEEAVAPYWDIGDLEEQSREAASTALAEANYLTRQWEERAGRETVPGALLTGAEQVGGGVLGVLEQVGKVPKRIYGGAVTAAHPEADEMEVEEWYPLSMIASSLGYRQLTDRNIWQESILDPESVMGQALQRVKGGEAAEAVAAELELPMVEMAVEAATDPLNFIEFVAPGHVRRLAGAISGAEAEVGAGSARMVSRLDRVLDVSRQADRATRPAQDVGRVEQLVGKWDDFKKLINPFEFTAESKANLANAETFEIVSNLLADADTAEEAATRLTFFRTNPGEAAKVYGRVLDSAAGRRTAATLRDLDLDAVEWLAPGRQFSPAAVAMELHDMARPVLEARYGVQPATGYRKFAKGFKSFMSQFYMNLNPGYAIRNALNNAVTLAWDGLGGLDRPEDLQRYLDEVAVLPARLQMNRGGAVAELAGDYQLPGVLGKLSERGGRLARESMIGEEAFYKRGFGNALRKTLGEVWHSGRRVPAPPAEVYQALGPEGVADLVAAVASGRNEQQIIERAMRAVNPQGPGDIVGFVLRYVPDEVLEAVTPGMVLELEQRVMAAGSREEAAAAFADMRRQVMQYGDAVLRRELLDPARARFSEAEDAETLAGLVDSLVEDARLFGVTDETALEYIRQLEMRWAQREQEVEAAATMLVEEAGAVREAAAQGGKPEVGRAAAEVCYGANRRVADLMEDTRRVVDTARREAWAAVEANPGAADKIWSKYFDLADRAWEQNFTDRIAVITDGRGDLERLAAGVDPADVVPASVRDMVEDRIRRQVDLEARAGRELEGETGFDLKLDTLRAQVDQAEEGAWSAAFASPDRDALDVLEDADRYVQAVARKWRAEREALRNELLNDLGRVGYKRKGMTKEQIAEVGRKRAKVRLEYGTKQDQLAEMRFGQQRRRWQIAEEELRYKLAGGGVPPSERPEIVAPEVFRRVAPPEGMDPLDAAMWEVNQIQDEIAQVRRDMQRGARPWDAQVLGRLQEEANTAAARGYVESRRALGELAEAEAVKVRRLGKDEEGAWALDYWRGDEVIGTERFDRWQDLQQRREMFEQAVPSEAAMRRAQGQKRVVEEGPTRFERMRGTRGEIEEARRWAADAVEQGATGARVQWDRQVKEWAVEFVDDSDPDALRVVSKYILGRDKSRAERAANLGKDVIEARAAGFEAVRQWPERYTRERFAGDLRDVFGLKDDEARAVEAIAEARAKAWAAATGRDPAEWYGERLAGMVKGGEPGAAYLQRGLQLELPGFGVVDEVMAEGTPAFRTWFKDSAAVDESGSPIVLYHGTEAPEEFAVFQAGPPLDEATGYERVSTSGDPTAYMGAHFAEEPEVAGLFAGVGARPRWLTGRAVEESGMGGRVYPVYLSVQNPAVYEREDELIDWILSLDMESSYEVEWAAQAYEGGVDAFWNEYQYRDFRRTVHEEILQESAGREDPGAFAQELGDAAQAELVEQGYDGVKYGNQVEGGTSWIAFEPEQVKSAIANAGSYNPADPNILFQLAGREDSDAFRRWFQQSAASDGWGEPLVLYHGTPRTFEQFDPLRANPESHWGAGIYLSDSPEDVATNYAGMGPDLTNRIEYQADRISSEFDYDPEPYLETLAELRGTDVDELEDLYEAGALELAEGEAQAIAKAQLMEHGGATMPVYASLQRPFVADPYGGGTRLSMEWRADLDDLAYEIGYRGVEELDRDELAEALADIRGGDEDEIWQALLDEEITLTDAEAQALAESGRFDGAFDEYVESNPVLVDDTGREMDLQEALEEAAHFRNINLEDIVEGDWPTAERVMAELQEALGFEFYNVSAEQFREAVAGLDSIQYLAGIVDGEHRLLSHQFVNEIVRALGYDGIVMDAGRAFPRMEEVEGVTHYILFEPEQVKSAIANVGTYDPADPRILYQMPGERGERAIVNWYSKAQKVVEQKMPARASVEQVRNILTKGGIKKDELEWSGVLRWLEEADRAGVKSLERDAVVGFLQEHQVRVREVVREQPVDRLAELRDAMRALEQERQALPEVGRTAEEWERVREIDRQSELAMDELGELGAKGYAWRYDDPDRLDFYTPEGRITVRHNWYQDDLEEVPYLIEFPDGSTREARSMQEVMDTARSRAMQPPRYERYTEPGGEQYRELLLQMPYETRQDLEWALVRRMEERGATEAEVAAVEANLGVRGAMGDEAFALANKYAPEELFHWYSARQAGGRRPYKSPHWEEPNVLAHVRFKDRVGEDGARVLFIEEIQSDWHQAGREKGYYNQERIDELTAQRAAGNREYARLDDLRRDALGAERQRLYEQQMELQEQGRLWMEEMTKARAGVPQAPFAKSWDELALKRMLKWAVDNGYDRIAWTTGAQQAKRYNLGQFVDELEWRRFDYKEIVPGGSWGDLSDVERAEILESGDYIDHWIQSPEDAMQRGFVTREEEPRWELSGRQGEGTVFYREVFGEEQLRELVGRDLAQRMSVEDKIGDVITGEALQIGGRGMSEFYDRILPYSMNKVGKRFGLKTGRGTVGMGEAFEPGWDVVFAPGGWTITNPAGEAVQTGFTSRVEAYDVARKLWSPEQSAEVWTVDLTEAARQKVASEGLSLFQGEGGKAAVEFLDDGRAILRALEQPDISSVAHELGHVFRRELGAEDLDIVERWAKVVDGEWTTAAEERFARGFERYLAEGVAPVEGLAEVFERFKAWLLQIYRQIRGSDIDVKMTDEVRGVFDRLLTEQPADPFDLALEAMRPDGGAVHAHPRTLEEAAEWNGYNPAEMTPEEWGELSQELQRERDAADYLSRPENLTEMAYRASHKGGEGYVEVGGYTREVKRKRSMSAKAEAEYRRGLMGALADNPKEFYRRQGEVAQWYHDLAADAAARAVGDTPAGRVAPEFLAADDMLSQWKLDQAALQVEELRRQVVDLRGRVGAEVGGVSRYQVRKAQGQLKRAEETLRQYMAAGQGRLDLRQAQGVMAGGQAVGRSVVEEIGAVRGREGVAEAPALWDLVRSVEPQQLAALDAMEQGVMGDWDRWAGRQADALTQQAVEGWVDNAVIPAFRDARAVGVKAAEDLANFALLNYSERNRLDELIQLVYPYAYWYTRSGMNWARRLAQDPQRLMWYMRYQQMMAQIHEQRGLRERFKGRWRIPIPEGMAPEWMEPSVYVDPTSVLFPFNPFTRLDWDRDEDAEKGLAAFYQTLQSGGFRAYPYIEIPMQLAGLLGESPEEVGDILPQTGLLRGVSAMMGAGPAGGYELEAPLRRAAGLQEQGPWDPYRVMRMLSSLAAQDPERWQVALDAQELQRRVVEGELELREATGEAPPGIALGAVMQEHGWDEQRLVDAQGLLQEAMRAAAQERGIGTAASFFGVPLSVVAKGEREQLALQEQGQALGWTPETPEGTRAEYQEFRAQHPEVASRAMGYQVVPGERESQWLTPGVYANLIQQQQGRDEIQGRFDDEIDALIRENPAARWEVGQLQDARQEELEAMEAEWPVPESEGEYPVARYGQSPEEYARAVLDDKLYELKDSLPAYGDYEDAGEWRAEYNAALAALPQSVPELEMAQKAGATSAHSLREALEAWMRRYDSPLEAMQRAYMDEVYGRAIEEREALVAAGMDKSKAWDRTVGAIGPMSAAELVPAVMRRNPDRGWTVEQLVQEYQGVELPSAEEMGNGGQDPETRAFWALIDRIPWTAEVRQEPLVAMMLEAEARATVTPEQVAAARKSLDEWLAANPDAQQAVMEAEEFERLREERWPGIRDVESGYFDVVKGERSSYLEQHPELREYWDWKDEYKLEHPVYTKFYDPDFDAELVKGYGRRKAEAEREPSGDGTPAVSSTRKWTLGKPWWEERQYSGRSYGGSRYWRPSGGGGYTPRRPVIRVGL